MMSAAIPNKLKWLFVFLTGVCVITGCRPVVLETELVETNGTVRYIEDNQPFTGFAVDRTRCPGSLSFFDQWKRMGCPSSMRLYKNGILDGPAKFWYADGTLKEERYYKNGLLHGVQKQYYPNGRIKARFNCIDGVRSGKEKVWDSDGNRLF